MNPTYHHHHHALSHSQQLPPPPSQNVYGRYEEPSPPYTTVSSSYTAGSGEFEVPPAKRQRLSGTCAALPGQNAGGENFSAFRGETVPTPVTLLGLGDFPPLAGGSTHPGDGVYDGGVNRATARQLSVAGPYIASTKSKRVRTGCLTCRERHLKCDEAVPDCLNCRKSSRVCKRGIRLNFLDIQVKTPPCVPPTTEWSVKFQDESRLIASEYRGGLGRYARLDQKEIKQKELTPPRETELDAAFRQQTRQEIISEPPRRIIESVRKRESFGDLAGFHDIDSSRMRNQQLQNTPEALFAIPGSHPTGMNPPGDPRGASFSLALANLNEPLGTREDPSKRGKGYKQTNHEHEHTSMTSSLVPQGAGAASQLCHPRPAPPDQAHGTPEGVVTPPNEKASTTEERDYLNTEEEIHVMQVFLEKVAIWMDALDRKKQFSRVMPNMALKSPMLLNAAIACGMKHLTLVSNYDDQKASCYYDTATSLLLRSLQNPDRNPTECATTAVVLNVYEIMSERPTQRMSHIAGSRALIRECRWDARAKGIGAACFWLNIGMEVLSCLAFNWQTAWDPDHWGVDMDFATKAHHGNGPGELAGGAGESDDGHPNGFRALSESGLTNSSSSHGGGCSRSSAFESGEDDDEEIWLHRIFYIVAKIGNFRASVPKFQEPSPHDEQARLQSRFAEWRRLKRLCNYWESYCPRVMRPFGYIHSRSSRSQFPNIWLITRSAVIGRLFYHTAMILLAQTNPLNPRDSEENRTLQLHHAHQVCGITAHTDDSGAASIAIRSMAIAGAVLADKTEQDEVLAILERINKKTGWRLEKVVAELKATWARGGAAAVVPQMFGLPPRLYPAGSSGNSSAAQAGVQRSIVNPLLREADFSLPNHPYKNWYAPPNLSNPFSGANSPGGWGPG